MARKRRKSQQRKQDRKLRTEKLEDRIVFSGCTEIQYTGNNHLYVATDYDDQIKVEFTSDNAGTIKRTSTINGSPVAAPPFHFSYASLAAVAVPDYNDPYLLIKGLKGNDIITINDNGFDYGFTHNNYQNVESPFTAHVAVYGGEGKDTIFGSGWRDYLSGGPGNDKIWGRGDGGMMDTLLGGPGNDTLTGGPGLQSGYWSDPHTEIICGGSGDDIIKAKGGDDIIYGGPGADTIDAGSGWDEIWGGSGRDVIEGGSGRDYIWGGPGRDEIWGGNGNDVIDGGAARDKIYGGNGKDEIFGGSGNDAIWGGAQDDWIFGGIGNDTLRGGTGTDYLYGQQGKDRLNGGSGIDYLYGGVERDQLWGGNDTVVDELLGQQGNDTFWQQTGVQDNLNDLLTGIDDLKWHTGNKEPWT